MTSFFLFLLSLLSPDCLWPQLSPIYSFTWGWIPTEQLILRIFPLLSHSHQMHPFNGLLAKAQTLNFQDHSWLNNTIGVNMPVVRGRNGVCKGTSEVIQSFTWNWNLLRNFTIAISDFVRPSFQRSKFTSFGGNTPNSNLPLLVSILEWHKVSYLHIQRQAWAVAQLGALGCWLSWITRDSPVLGF